MKLVSYETFPFKNKLQSKLSILEFLDISRLDSPVTLKLSKIKKFLGEKRLIRSILKLFALKLNKKLSEKSKLTVTKLSIEESSLNKINAELLLKFKSTKYFCAKLSLTNKSILEFIMIICRKIINTR